MHYSQLEKSWLDSRINHELVSLLTYQVAKIVTPTTGTRRQKPKRTIAPHITTETTVPPLHEFIDILSRRSNTHIGTLLVALILLTRLAHRLGHVTTGMASAPQRIFLASLIISTKLIHDTSPKNKHWLSFANDYFELDEINLMEKQFLTLMDFNLSISDNDFQQAVNRYKLLQKDGRRNHNINNNKKEWQETPDCLVAPGRNVALAAGKNTTLTRPYSSLSASSSASSLSSSSSSSTSTSILSVSMSHQTPIFDPLSNSSSTSTLQSHSSASPMTTGSFMETISLNDSTCDDPGLNRCYPTNYMSPLFSV
ncbi:hypothetical protein BCR42DRAFT_402631 [Absidia repens]|uniref:Cyclin N-terminal domain-containing protein n=1 Tax=Absidia repens TaxID=90262 RepID=A0A1X2IYB9_9FUNG|nr:hypothetical protein BCR42DRAFT_402631 [Absidia repens]